MALAAKRQEIEGHCDNLLKFIQSLPNVDDIDVDTLQPLIKQIVELSPKVRELFTEGERYDVKSSVLDNIEYVVDSLWKYRVRFKNLTTNKPRLLESLDPEIYTLVIQRASDGESIIRNSRIVADTCRAFFESKEPRTTPDLKVLGHAHELVLSQTNDYVKISSRLADGTNAQVIWSSLDAQYKMKLLRLEQNVEGFIKSKDPDSTATAVAIRDSVLYADLFMDIAADMLRLWDTMLLYAREQRDLWKWYYYALWDMCTKLSRFQRKPEQKAALVAKHNIAERVYTRRYDILMEIHSMKLDGASSIDASYAAHVQEFRTCATVLDRLTRQYRELAREGFTQTNVQQMREFDALYTLALSDYNKASLDVDNAKPQRYQQIREMFEVIPDTVQAYIRKHENDELALRRTQEETEKLAGVDIPDRPEEADEQGQEDQPEETKEQEQEDQQEETEEQGQGDQSEETEEEAANEDSIKELDRFAEDITRMGQAIIDDCIAQTKPSEPDAPTHFIRTDAIQTAIDDLERQVASYTDMCHGVSHDTDGDVLSICLDAQYKLELLKIHRTNQESTRGDPADVKISSGDVLYSRSSVARWTDMANRIVRRYDEIYSSDDGSPKFSKRFYMYLRELSNMGFRMLRELNKIEVADSKDLVKPLRNLVTYANYKMYLIFDDIIDRTNLDEARLLDESYLASVLDYKKSVMLLSQMNEECMRLLDVNTEPPTTETLRRVETLYPAYGKAVTRFRTASKGIHQARFHNDERLRESVRLTLISLKKYISEVGAAATEIKEREIKEKSDDDEEEEEEEEELSTEQIDEIIENFEQTETTSPHVALHEVSISRYEHELMTLTILMQDVAQTWDLLLKCCLLHMLSPVHIIGSVTKDVHRQRIHELCQHDVTKLIYAKAISILDGQEEQEQKV